MQGSKLSAPSLIAEAKVTARRENFLLEIPFAAV